MGDRKDLQAATLFGGLRQFFDRHAALQQSYDIQRRGRCVSLTDALMSGVAMFSLKFPSLLQFDTQSTEPILRHNLKHLYGIQQAPSDTYMRQMLDVVDPTYLYSAFKSLYQLAQRGKLLERFVFMDGYYLLSMDGTGHFSSHDVHCSSCCEKKHRDGTVTYYHHMLSAVLVHPDEPVVLPLGFEPMLKEDGSKKNDCERNAGKRLIPRIHKDYPRLKCIVIEDSLASNGPHITMLKAHDFRFILGVKPGDHSWLFDWVAHSQEVQICHYKDAKKHITLRYLNGIPLNDTHRDIIVNYLECTETKADGKQTRFSWITDIEITNTNVKTLMKGGRARWKIENETFNTLKNQGYQFEHNFGHGKKHLSTVLACLMMLAFTIDQLQQMASKRFKHALARVRNNKKALWERLRGAFVWLVLEDWEHLFDYLTGLIDPIPPPSP